MRSLKVELDAGLRTFKQAIEELKYEQLTMLDACANFCGA